MYKFLTEFFMSEEEKLAEQYETYKKSFSNEFTLYRKGSVYIFKYFIIHPRNSKPLETKMKLHGHDELKAKAYYVYRCKELEENRKPLIEVKV